MTVIVHENKKLSSLISQLNLDTATGSPEENKLSREQLIRQSLENDPKFEVWVPLVYYWTNGVTLNTDTVMVSIKGALAYEVDGDLHINYGDLESGYPQVSVNILGNQHTLQLGRAVASTFLTVPDVYKGIKEADLDVIHLDGQGHQCHLLNLEWKLNKSEKEQDVIEKTVEALNTEMPTEE